jgi:hypothetical protein
MFVPELSHPGVFLVVTMRHGALDGVAKFDAVPKVRFAALPLAIPVFPIVCNVQFLVCQDFHSREGDQPDDIVDEDERAVF